MILPCSSRIDWINDQKIGAARILNRISLIVA
ncbi:hypothetical protein LINPERHAP1_LOCUS38761, partial [Linum perenne]